MSIVTHILRNDSDCRFEYKACDQLQILVTSTKREKNLPNFLERELK